MNNDEIIEHAKTVAAHWIIEDKGFAGVVYKCSNCGESWNDYYCKFPKDFCARCGKDIDEDANEHVEEIKYIKKTDNTIPSVEIPKLIDWLLGEKYICVDETSDDMTEEFEKKHQWELSRNYFINRIIRQLEQWK